MARLNKKDVEELLARYDTDHHEALLKCLHIVLDDTSLTWEESILHLHSTWDKEALLRRDTVACDALVKYLVETRSLEKI